jgi:fructose-1,6-bisphosphatase-3
MSEEGEFLPMNICGKVVKGKALMDAIDDAVRRAYYGDGKEKDDALDLMLYLWEGSRSPLFHKDKMSTFERYFIADKAVQAEQNGAYYTLANRKDICEKILTEFGLDPTTGRIINGHIPVRTLKGESPMRAEGKRYVIDGGFSKPYQEKTGIAGYTLIYNSHGIQLVQHEMFESREQAILSGSDIHSRTLLQDFSNHRIRVRETDKGQELMQQVRDLQLLLEAYQTGTIKEAE